MLGNPDPQKCINDFAEAEKKHIKAMLAIIGFRILSQTFEKGCECGLIITRAKMVEDEGTYYNVTEEDIRTPFEYGSFDNPKIVKFKEKQYLNISGIDISNIKDEDR